MITEQADLIIADLHNNNLEHHLGDAVKELREEIDLVSGASHRF